MNFMDGDKCGFILLVAMVPLLLSLGIIFHQKFFRNEGGSLIHGVNKDFV
jgi:hypothetical protein